MAKKTKEEISIHDAGWTDYVLDFLEDDEKIMGNPTTDGLRRIFEPVMKCELIDSSSTVVQTPQPTNEKRATVVVTLRYESENKLKSVCGSADVYWGNCDKVYRNHPVAVAETRAEGRALRRALRLRKVLAAEEVVEDVEDIDGNTVTNITNNQINFIDVLAKRLDVNVFNLANHLSIDVDDNNVHKMKHEDAVNLIKQLSEYQLDVENIPENVKNYDNKWK